MTHSSEPPSEPQERPGEPSSLAQAASPDEVTRLLVAWGAGDSKALDALIPLVYEELRRIAARAMRVEPTGHTLQSTALVAEAYLRLVDQRNARWQDRAHFFGVAARLMRQILVDHARARHTQKRGGADRHHVPLTHAAVGPEASVTPVELLALHDALARLGALDPELERLVELRYFGGLTIAETAQSLGVAPATVKRQWGVARAWLRRELGGSDDRPIR